MLAFVDRLLVHTFVTVGLVGLVGLVYFFVVVGLGRVPEDSERSVLGLSMVAAGARRDPGPAGPPSPRGDRQPAGLRRAASARRRAEDLRDPHVPRGADGRAAAPAGRVAAQDDGADRGRDLDGCRRELRAGRVGPRPGRRPPLAVRRGAHGGGPGPRLGQRLGPGVDAVAARAPDEVRGAGGLDRPPRRAARVCSCWSARPMPPPFTDEEDQVLTDLARQVGLALHNVRLDSALQASLDELQGAQRGAAGVPAAHRHRRPTSPAAGSSATCTTGPSSTWWPWP